MNAMFKSVLAVEMDEYLKLRSAVVGVTSFAKDKRILSLFDQYLVLSEYQAKGLTEEILTKWSLTLTGKSKTVKEKLETVRGFCKYLNTIGFHSFLPVLPKVKSDYIPYIFSDQEVAMLFHYADNLTPAVPEATRSRYYLMVPMALRILFGCGTRLNETMAIQRKDIDFKTRTILLKETKFSKDRVIPFHESLAEILENYCLKMGIMDQPDAHIFPGQKPGRYFTPRQMDFWFSKLLKLAGIDQRENRMLERGACLHCFRHLFVLKSMQQLEAAGHSVNMNDLILPTYLGHDCLIDTDQYMRFSGNQLPEALDSFEAFSAGLIPDVEVPYEEE